MVSVDDDDDSNLALDFVSLDDGGLVALKFFSLEEDGLATGDVGLASSNVCLACLAVVVLE